MSGGAVIESAFKTMAKATGDLALILGSKKISRASITETKRALDKASEDLGRLLGG